MDTLSQILPKWFTDAYLAVIKKWDDDDPEDDEDELDDDDEDPEGDNGEESYGRDDFTKDDKRKEVEQLELHLPIRDKKHGKKTTRAVRIPEKNNRRGDC